MQSGNTPPTKLSPVIWGYLCTARSSQGWRSMLRSKVSGILPRLWRVTARYVFANRELSVSSRRGVSILPTPISSTHACTHRPISTPAVQNEPVLSFAPGSEERRNVIQVMAVPRGSLVSKALYLTAWERGYIKGDSLAFHLHKYSQLG